MKSAILVTVTALVLASAASASNGGGNKAGNGAQTGHISATYTSFFGGVWTCSGERVAKTKPKAFTKDSEDCTIGDPASYLPPGTWVGTQDEDGFAYIRFNADVVFYWGSDFDGQVARALTEVVSLNRDGTGHVHIVAYY